jgi:uncharacterized protein
VLAGAHNTVVRDNIENNRLISVSDRIREVLDTREFQRLRHIRQMGLSSYVFPTAEHSRFTHSLGVYATALQAFRNLERKAVAFDFETPGVRFDDDLELEFSIAALCHDLGHSAFSHVLEKVLLPEGVLNHEECTRAIVLDPEREISRAISNVSDLQSVTYFLEGSHPNRALTELISSAFDVDRCDYILRDSRMSGVEYGSYDLKWLMHAMAIETNSLNQPVLLLDGPRGLDALRQFLSARRFLHRQVYFHPTIRAAQILLKAIFSRIQDLEPSERTRELVPISLHAIVDHNRLSMDDFLDTRDVEINMMVANLAKSHPDATLRYLAELFVQRKFPQCILDSGRSSSVLSDSFRIQDDTDGVDSEYASFASVIDDLRAHVSQLMGRQGLPAEAASYLVVYDPADFESTAPTDLLFSFGRDVVTFPEIDSRCVGFDIESLLDSFRLHRVFVPRGFDQPGKERLKEKYEIIENESGGMDG